MGDTLSFSSTVIDRRYSKTEANFWELNPKGFTG